MSLIYTKDSPPTYQPKGFQDATEIWPANIYSWSYLWNSPSKSLEAFDAGHHQISLACDGNNLAAAEVSKTSQEEDLNMRTELQKMGKSSSQSSDLISTHNESSVPNFSGFSDNPPHSSHLSGEPLRGEIPFDGLRILRSDAGKHRSPPPSPPYSKRIKTSSASTYTPSFRTRRPRNLTAVKMAELVVQACAIENSSPSNGYVFDKEKLSKGQIVRLFPMNDVRCDCGDSQKDPNMV